MNAPGLPTVDEGAEPYEIVEAPTFVGSPYPEPRRREVDTLAAVRRHWRLIIGLATVGSVCAYLLCQTLTPLYPATATVMIDPREPKQPAMSADPASAATPSEESVRKNQIALIRSRQLIEAVVLDLGLDRDPEFNPLLHPPSLLEKAIRSFRSLPSKFAEVIGLWRGRQLESAEPDEQQVLDKAVDQFLGRLKTTAADASRVIQIGFSSQIPERAARVANAVAERYMQDKVRQDATQAQSAIQALRKEIEALNVKIRDSEHEIEKLRGAKGLLPNSDLKVMAEQLEALDKELTKAETEKIAATYRVASAAARATDVALAEAKEAALRKMVEAAKADMAKASASEADVRALERETEANRTLMALLVGRLNDTAAQINREGPEVRLLSKAIVPEKPSFPPKLPLIAVAFLFSAAGGTILGVLLERRDQSIRSTEELRQVTTARVLGAVPAIKRVGPLGQSPMALVLAEPTSMFAENLRAVWFRIDHALQSHAKTLVITSAVSGEGKTSIAVSLARMLALGGRRVVIVDGDLRHPSAHCTLGLKQSPGLADILEDSLQVEDVLQKDEPSGASFLAAGGPVCSPADYLQSPKVAKTLQNLSAAFDAVIVDTPPVLGVDDAGIMARHADMTVMVVRWGATKGTTFNTAVQRLHDLDIPVSGVVLTMVDRKKYGVYGYPDEEAFAPSLRKYYTS